MKRAIRIDPSDNVATAVEALEPGEAVAVSGAGGEETLPVVDAVPRGHKIALAPIRAGDRVRKYGEVIGRASRPIRKGELVHVHNLEGVRGRGDLAKGKSE